MSDDDAVADAEDSACVFDARAMGDAIEAVLLGGPRKYTWVEVGKLAGTEPSRGLQLWRSMGFAAVDDDEVVFTDGDVEALRRVDRWRAIDSVDDDVVVATTRVMGQVFAQLASWEGELVFDEILDQVNTAGSAAGFVDFSERLLPLLEQTHAYVWRRQIAAYFARKVAQAHERTLNRADAAVGFADISGFTSLTRHTTETELHRLLDAFESTAVFVVGAHGGRVVKMIGDAVLFVVDTPAQAAEIALELLESWQADLPPIRVGVAAGPIVSRLGDVFGSTVNIASRLTSISRPGWVLVDRHMHEALEHDATFRLRARPPESVRGYERLQPWRLRRAVAQRDGPAVGMT